VLVEKKEDVAAFADYIVEEEDVVPAAAATPTPAPPQPQPEKKAEAPAVAAAPVAAPAPSPAGGRILASPIARKLAEERGIDLSLVRGTGPEGRIIKEDVLNFKPGAAAAAAAAPKATSAPAAAAPPAAAYTEIPLSNMRLVIARRLTESKQTVPHYYQTIDVRMDKILQYGC